MKQTLAKLVPQPLVAIVASILAISILAWMWIGDNDSLLNVDNLRALPVAIVLLIAVVVAGHYPIHYGLRFKIAIITVPLYLMAVLLPRSISPFFAGLSILLLELLLKSKKGNLPSDIATAASRWTCVTFLGATVAHLPVTDELGYAFLLLGTAVLLFVGDSFTFACESWSMTGELPWQSFPRLVKEGALVEGAQYLLAMLGAFAALKQIWALALLALPTTIVYFAFKNAREMHESTRKLLENMADTVDLRDPFTGGHSRRVAELGERLLRELKVFGPEAALIASAARLHDIGKIAIPDEVLKKSGMLSAEEWQVMRAHPGHGADLLVRYPDFARGTAFVLHHHEQWDGSGYPSHLKGLDIPFGARVIAVLDAFDAMTNDRPYRKAMSEEQAMLVLRAGAGKQWDPTIVDAFLRVMATGIQRTPSPVHDSSMQVSNPV